MRLEIHPRHSEKDRRADRAQPQHREGAAFADIPEKDRDHPHRNRRGKIPSRRGWLRIQEGARFGGEGSRFRWPSFLRKKHRHGDKGHERRRRHASHRRRRPGRPGSEESVERIGHGRQSRFHRLHREPERRLCLCRIRHAGFGFKIRDPRALGAGSYGFGASRGVLRCQSIPRYNPRRRERIPFQRGRGLRRRHKEMPGRIRRSETQFIGDRAVQFRRQNR